jgi:hypothetical protein
MNLRLFHAFLIFLCAALAVLLGSYCLALYGRDGGLASLLSGIASFVMSVVLVAYDSWFLRKTRMLQ